MNENKHILNSLKQLMTLGCLLVTFSLSAQGDETTEQPVNDSPLGIDLSIFGHSLFGDGIKTLPGKTSLGLGFEGALKYSRGDIGLALAGGFWRANYTPEASGTQFTTRLEHISAHYIMFGPYFKMQGNKMTFEINPKVGVQRFYFPHFTGRVAPVNGGNPGPVTHWVRTDFDAGISTGLGLKGSWKIDNDMSLHFRADYMTTLGKESFKYRYSSPSGVVTNTKGLQSISFGAGASLAIKSKTNNSSKSFAPTALDIAAGAGLNFLIGKGIDNLPGEKSTGYDADLTLNYRIGRSGVALSGGFWDNKYDARSLGTPGLSQQRLDNISAHYVNLGPILPILKKGSKIGLEVVPHIGIQRLYFPHSTLEATINGPVTRTVRTNLEAGWSAGLAANLLFPIDPKLDLKIGADYTSMLTDRSFGFTVSGLNAVTNRTPLERLTAGVGVVYNIMQKVEAVDDDMSPEKIAEMIDQKEDDMDATDGTDTEDKDGIDMQVGDDRDPNNDTKKETETIIETVDPTQEKPTTTNPEVTNPETTNPSTTDPSNTTDPNTIDPSTTDPNTTTDPATTNPSTISPVISDPINTTTYPSDQGSGIVYRVQFVALSKDVKVFNELKQYGTVILEYYATKGLYRYMVGDAATREEGIQLLNRVHANGWPKAFLVKYDNGTRTRIY